MWTDESHEGYAPLTVDPSIQDIMDPGEDEDYPCESEYTYNNGKCYNYSCSGGFYLDYESYKCVNEYDWHDFLNPDSKVYTRTTGSLAEVCGVFGTGNAGTVCMTSTYFNSDYATANYYNPDFYDCGGESSYDGTGETCLKGYAKAKADEMLSKGATSCSVNRAYVSCNIPKEEPDDFPDEYIIRGIIASDGYVEFHDGKGNFVYVSRNGDYNW